MTLRENKFRRERDEAREECKKLTKDMVTYQIALMRDERDEARVEVKRLKVKLQAAKTVCELAEKYSCHTDIVEAVEAWRKTTNDPT